MPEEKIVRINLRKQLNRIPKWKRRATFSRILRKRLKNDKMKIAQGLNEKIWLMKTPKVRLKIVKDEKIAEAELVVD